MFTKTTALEPKNGSIAGFQTECTVCGLEMRNSLEMGLIADQIQHREYHERVAKRRLS